MYGIITLPQQNGQNTKKSCWLVAAWLVDSTAVIKLANNAMLESKTLFKLCTAGLNARCRRRRHWLPVSAAAFAYCGVYCQHAISQKMICSIASIYQIYITNFFNNSVLFFVSQKLNLDATVCRKRQFRWCHNNDVSNTGILNEIGIRIFSGYILNVFNQMRYQAILAKNYENMLRFVKVVHSKP